MYRGPNVMMGYAQCREDLGLADELGGCLATGDLAAFDADGYLTVLGRAKRDAKLFGLRINLDEVENLLRANGPTAVVATSERLVIYCEYGDADRFTCLRNELAAQLRIHHQAFDFRRIQNLPLSANGKIDYAQLAVAQ
jgi:non-ribosomal peptide synthetase component E (peptide arylation enzyme)